jgi:hypothetical protein
MKTTAPLRQYPIDLAGMHRKATYEDESAGQRPEFSKERDFFHDVLQKDDPMDTS